MNTTLTFRIPAIAFAALSLGACSGAATRGASSSTTMASASAATPTTVTPATAVPVTAAAQDVRVVDVTFSGGYETDPADGGRPVALVASLLGVTPEVFRTAFSGVTPAGGAQPDAEQVHSNKQALLAVLGPYGVTNDALDAASNTYRYLAAAGETWEHAPAVATATVVDGEVTEVTVLDGGHGYTSAPTVSIGLPDGSVVTGTATVAYTDDVSTNGSISAITVDG